MTDETRESRTGPRVMVVDDDQLLCPLLQRWLETDGYAVSVYHTGEDCLNGLTQTLPAAIILDLAMPGIGGVETLRRVKEHHPRIPVIVLTSDPAVESAVSAMKTGAFDYLTKPPERTKLLTELRNAVERNEMAVRIAQLEREVRGEGYPGIVGRSEVMRQLFREMERVAPSDITVLIHGESGTGKELVARALHEHSERRTGPFVALSCAAIPETLQESELFGHEKGAFTGASARRNGCFERADGGTLLLDEIGELTVSLQAKLLRVLQERTFQRVGGSQEIRSDFRLLAATNRDLTTEVTAGRFRQDLYFRVVVMELHVPPLRERLGDVPLLAEHFLTKAPRPPKRGALQSLGADTLDVLSRYHWPGNVRELQNAMERALVVARGKVIRPADLPKQIRTGFQAPIAPSGPAAAGAPFGHTAVAPEVSESDLATVAPVRTLEELEQEAIEASLQRHAGKILPVVRELGISRTTLYRKMKKYGLR